MSEDIHKLVEITNDRITDLHKSYLTLNENHHKLELGFVEIKAKLETVAFIIKFFITPSIAILVIAQLARIMGVPV